MFFLTNVKSTSNFFLPHHELYNAGVFKVNNHYVLNPKFFIIKWKQGVEFLINVFYLTHNHLIFGTEFFKKETSAFNWEFFTTQPLWKISPYSFLYKETRINHVSNSFYFKLKQKNIDCVFIYDAYYHFKTLYYLNRYKYFSIGFSHSRINPWIFSYSFFVLNDSILTQSVFFYLINFTKKIALHHKFYTQKSYWTFFTTYTLYPQFLI